MIRTFTAAIFAVTLLASPASAQSVAELRAQLAQLDQQLAQAAAAGVDAGMLAELRVVRNQIAETIDEMSADSPSAAPVADQDAYPYPPKQNWLVLNQSQACAGFTEENYRQRALASGPDVQINSMCGQAFEYYTMYKRAIRQGYSEADAERTYQAHVQAAANAKSFYDNNRS